MDLYIKGIGCISPQLSYDNAVFLSELKSYTQNRLSCIEPDYTPFFDQRAMRRMSRIVKYSTAAGLMALRDAGIEKPDAISTGTGWGLLEESGKFLAAIIEANEEVVSPTAFIQSTHNTVSANIAVLVGCHAHNNTFSHKAFSFESALLDAQLTITENKYTNFLVGTYDETTDYSFGIMNRFHLFKNNPCTNFELLDYQNNGVLAGEGSAFFVLTPEPNPNSYGIFKGCTQILNAKDTNEIQNHISIFLEKNKLTLKDVDIVLSGLCGEQKQDEISLQLNRDFFTEQTICIYKNLCGEYFTASSFAFWLAAKMMKTQTIPSEIVLQDKHRKPKNILFYNAHATNFSVMLFQAC